MLFSQPVDCRQRRAYAEIVGDVAVAVERHIEVGAHEHARPAFKRKVFELRNGSETHRYFVPMNSTRSTRRFE